jgi:hypothetical protein
MNKTQTKEQTNTQHLKPITQNDLAQNTGYRKTNYTSQSMEYGTPKSRNACLKCLMPNEMLNDT